MEKITLVFRRRSDGAEVIAVIDENGDVNMTVRGAAGMTCRTLTATLEGAIGDVTNRTAHAGSASAEQHEAEQVKMRGGGWCG